MYKGHGYTGRQCSIHNMSYVHVSLTAHVYLYQLNRSHQWFVRQRTTANTSIVLRFAVKTSMYANTGTTISLQHVCRKLSLFILHISSVSKHITGTQIT